jgi:hypothetical protein
MVPEHAPTDTSNNITLHSYEQLVPKMINIGKKLIEIKNAVLADDAFCHAIKDLLLAILQRSDVKNHVLACLSAVCLPYSTPSAS